MEQLISINKAYKFPKDKIRNEFLKSLKNDLELLNGKVVQNDNDEEDYISFSYESKYYSYQNRESIAKNYGKIRKRLLLTHKEFIEKIEVKGNILNLFANGRDIDIEKINPEIRICKSSKDKDIYRYCRYLQEVPNSGGAGRRLNALVYDTGQDREYLMGIIGLSSCGYSLKDRDNYLGWNSDYIDSRQRLKDLKNAGLKKMMQLSVSLAVPPYNSIFGGKLISMLAFSDEISVEFRRKYKHELLALVTTSAFGIHNAVFNRIQLKKLFKDKDWGRLELFERIGKTSEYSSLILSEETKKIGKKILENTTTYNKKKKRTKANFSSDSDLNRVIRMCGLNKEILQLNEKAIYIGTLHNSNLRILQGKDDNSPILNVKTDEILEYWVNHFIKKKILKYPDNEKLESFNNFRKEELSIVGQLELF